MIKEKERGKSGKKEKEGYCNKGKYHTFGKNIIMKKEKWEIINFCIDPPRHHQEGGVPK